MKNHKRLGLSGLPLILGLVMLITAPLEARAALDAYMIVTGEDSGVIVGDVDIAPHLGKIQVVEYAHSVSEVIDGATGLPTGARQHRPVRVTKPLDRASPWLMQGMFNGENLTNVTIEFYRPSGGGADEHYMTLQMSNARVTNISQISGSEDELQAKPAQEVITFVYGTITWIWENPLRQAEDNWLVFP